MKHLSKPGTHYRTLDLKLSNALLKLQTGEFGKRVLVMKKRQMRKYSRDVLLSGRQILWMLYQHFRTNSDLGFINSIVDMYEVKRRGVKEIETFRNEWERVIESLLHKTSKNTLAILLYTQMSQSEVLQNNGQVQEEVPGPS